MERAAFKVLAMFLGMTYGLTATEGRFQCSIPPNAPWYGL
jgi:hypothetical protein